VLPLFLKPYRKEKAMSTLLTRFLRRLGKVHAALWGFTAVFLFASAALALVLPPSFAPRQFQTQQTHYLRFTFNFNSCVIPAGAAVCNVKVGALPYNAFIKAAYIDLLVTFNPTTSATVGVGTVAGTSNLVAAFNVFTAQTVQTTVQSATGTTPSGLGLLVTSGTAQTGTNGGFDIYANYTTGANGSQGTQGQVVFIIEYFAPNDGSCAPVPMGTQPGAC
jgi:hypothetical protein